MEGLATGLIDIAIIAPNEARHAIASAFLGTDAPDSSNRERTERLGDIELQPHQTEAIGRLRSSIAEFGGALLCDPVGTGKTYCALGVAASYRRTLVIAPAALRPMWRQASEASGIATIFVSHESLSRGHQGAPDRDLVIVDEAHHARNTATKRFAALSRIVAGRDVLLMSATPIHNCRADLDALLSLFLGHRSSTLSSAELGRCIVRREEALSPKNIGIPATEQLVWFGISHQDSIANALLVIPPPLPPREGGDGGALIAHSLVRQWASSDAALLGALVRRRNRAIALIAALEAGTYPSRAQLEAWSAGDDSIQFAFAELIAPSFDQTAGLLIAIQAHLDGVRGAIDLIGRYSACDEERANVIRDVRARHPGVHVVAFSQYEATVRAMFRRLARDGGAAALTGSGGQVTGGRISRADAIARFAPRAANRKPPAPSESITLLLTTDLLSEGVNLQDAGVVVHLDLPWTPARMEQRLGRIARIGSRHRAVYSYAIHPPASAESIARIEAILEMKMRSAGILTRGFPSLGFAAAARAGERNEPHLVEALRDRLARWASGLPASAGAGSTAVGVSAVTAEKGGFLAAWRRGRRTILLGSNGTQVSDDPAVLVHAASIAEGPETVVDEFAARKAISEIARHLDASAALEDVRPAHASSSRATRRVLKRIASAVGRARPHARSRIATLALEARRITLARLGEHHERELASFASLDVPDERWLEFVIELGLRHRVPSHFDGVESGELVALIVFMNADQVNALSRAKER